MTHPNLIEFEQEHREKLQSQTDEELITSFNREVGNKGRTSTRAVYLSLLHEEFVRRGFDCSVIENPDKGFSYAHHIVLMEED